MSISFNYSRQFDPTMPVVEVSVRAVGTSHPASVVTALVDSGADATILPLLFCNRLEPDMFAAASCEV